MEVALDKVFTENELNSMPAITSEIIVNFIKRMTQKGFESTCLSEKMENSNFKMDFVHQKRTKTLYELKGIFYNTNDLESKHSIILVVNESKNEIASLKCETCFQEKGPCAYGISFLFWIHRKTADKKCDDKFWPVDIESIIEQSSPTPVPTENEQISAVQLKDIFISDEVLDCEEYEDFTEDEGQLFLRNVLDEMDRVGLTESAFFKHCRPTQEPFESLYIHHIMLDNANNDIKDYKSFIMHMENQSKHNTFDKLAQSSIYNYKKPLWMETQYGRIRCSLLHRITNLKNSKDSSSLLESILCKNREWNSDDKKQLKEHKRFILKQTEKLENKVYRKCGLLLNENYPYICASPDGITDDHIVEIKAPKSDNEFEKYLVGKETIAPKYMAQIQMQMYLANVTKALYCVLSPLFDTNGALHYVWVQADMEMVASLLSHAEDYWKDIVFPNLKKIYMKE